LYQKKKKLNKKKPRKILGTICGNSLSKIRELDNYLSFVRASMKIHSKNDN
jgi:hypothetical protein